MKNVLRVNHENRTIVMDRAFAKAAVYVGSSEYNMLQSARRDYPNYEVVRREIKKNPNKESYNGLTYEYMKTYIATHKNAEVMLREYEEMILRSKCHSIRYPHIKKWFLDSYPEVEENFKQERRTADDRQAA